MTAESRRRERSRVKERRAAWIHANGPCVRCYSWNNLEVDHVNPKDKKHEAIKIWQWGRFREFERIAELAKCQVLCRSCHLKKTWLEDRKPAQHGTNSMYSLKCRCDDCRKAHRDWMHRYRIKKAI